MTRQRLARGPNRSHSRTRARAIRFRQVRTPARSSLQRLDGDHHVGREAAAGAAVVGPRQQRLQDLQEGLGDRGLFCWLAGGVDAPGARVGGNAGLGVAASGTVRPGPKTVNHPAAVSIGASRGAAAARLGVYVKSGGVVGRGSAKPLNHDARAAEWLPPSRQMLAYEPLVAHSDRL